MGEISNLSTPIRDMRSCSRPIFNHIFARRAATSTKVPSVWCSFSEDCCGAQYVVHCPETKSAVIIDSVLDYEPQVEKLGTKSADSLLEFVHGNQLNVEYLLETHLHADHLTGVTYLQQQLAKGDSKPAIGIGENVTQLQPKFATRYGVDLPQRHFDKFIKDGEQFTFGNLTVEALSTPGHTPACMSYVIGDTIFVGDTFFMTDSGAARCDFPGGSAEELWNSLQKILNRPDNVRMFLAHDYKAGGSRSEFVWETTVGAQRANNIHLKGKSKEEFIKLRQDRDKTLSLPRLIHASLQFNISAGRPSLDSKGRFNVHIPHKITWKNS